MSLKIKMFIGFTLAVVIIFSIFSYYTFNETTKTIISEESKMLKHLENSLFIQMEEQIKTAEISALTLANNKEVQRLFSERNRIELTNMLLDTYSSISKDITQVQFHLPDSISFLRLHDINKFGDSLKDFRFTVNEANEKKEIIKGLEKGVAGFGFRVVVPISYENKHLGTVEYGSDFGKSFLEVFKENHGGEYFIYEFESKNLLAATSEDIWDLKEEEYFNQLQNYNSINLQSSDKNHNIVLIPFKDYSGNISGYFKIIQDRSALVQNLDRIKRNSFIFTSIGLIILLSFFYFFLNYSLSPIKELLNITEKIRNGDLSNNVEIKSQDELGVLGDSFNSMLINLRSIIFQSIDVSHTVASTSEELSASSEEVTASSEEISSTVVDVANSATIQTDSIKLSEETIDNMMNNMDTMIENIEQVNIYTKNTLYSANKGIDFSKEAVEKINLLKESTENTSREIIKLNNSSKEIQSIVDTIKDISDQTNLLALNAAIEAARAGHAGRGFSVVAEEIRKLSEETNISLEKISSLIHNIQKHINNSVKSMESNNIIVENGVTMVEESSNNFSHILEEINSIVNQMSNLNDLTKMASNSSREVKKSFGTVSELSNRTVQSVEEIVNSTEQQSMAMEEIATSATKLAALATELFESISIFKY